MTTWIEATTLEDLGELTALWLEGALRSSPWQFGPANAETSEIVEILARLNRAGFVTEHSQPAMGPDAHGYAQRATVNGFVDEDLARQLEVATCTTDLIVVSFNEPADIPCTIPITFSPPDVRGRAGTWVGGAMGLDEMFGRCFAGETTLDSGESGRTEAISPVMVAELLGSVQVTLIDPVWGRTDRLWDFLDEQLDTLA